MPYLTCLCFEAQTRGNDIEAAQCVSVVISTYFGLNSITLGFDTAGGDDHDFKGTWWVRPIKTGVRHKDQRMCQLKMSLQKKQLFANAAKACHKQIWTEMFACTKYSKKERAETLKSTESQTNMNHVVMVIIAVDFPLWVWFWTVCIYTESIL